MVGFRVFSYEAAGRTQSKKREPSCLPMKSHQAAGAACPPESSLLFQPLLFIWLQTCRGGERGGIFSSPSFLFFFAPLEQQGLHFPSEMSPPSPPISPFHCLGQALGISSNWISCHRSLSFLKPPLLGPPGDLKHGSSQKLLWPSTAPQLPSSSSEGPLGPQRSGLHQFL